MHCKGTAVVQRHNWGCWPLRRPHPLHPRGPTSRTGNGRTTGEHTLADAHARAREAHARTRVPACMRAARMQVRARSRNRVNPHAAVCTTRHTPPCARRTCPRARTRLARKQPQMRRAEPNAAARSQTACNCTSPHAHHGTQLCPNTCNNTPPRLQVLMAHMPPIRAPGGAPCPAHITQCMLSTACSIPRSPINNTHAL